MDSASSRPAVKRGLPDSSHFESSDPAKAARGHRAPRAGDASVNTGYGTQGKRNNAWRAVQPDLDPPKPPRSTAEHGRMGSGQPAAQHDALQGCQIAVRKSTSLPGRATVQQPSQYLNRSQPSSAGIDSKTSTDHFLQQLHCSQAFVAPT